MVTTAAQRKIYFSLHVVEQSIILLIARYFNLVCKHARIEEKDVVGDVVVVGINFGMHFTYVLTITHFNVR